jgi:hypothetical protein
MCKQIITKAVGYSHFCLEDICKKNNGSSCNMCHLWEQISQEKRILNAVKDYYSEDTKKIDQWTSLSSFYNIIYISTR